MTSPKLSDADFLQVIELTPLVAIDLVVRDETERVLLGLRRNEPAKDTWFAPGARILKNEDLDQAFLRITQSELGVSIPRSKANLLGVYSHQYNENYLLRAGISTHYIVIAYEIVGLQLADHCPEEQHADYRWWSSAEVLGSESVHPNNLPYFGLNNTTR